MWNKPTPKMLNKIPRIGKQDGVRDPKVYLKFFIGGWTWYVTEYDPKERLFFGLVVSPMMPEGEWGYFSYDELRSIRKGFMEIDRDMYTVSPYEPKRLSEIRR